MSWSQATYQKAWSTLARTFIPALFHRQIASSTQRGVAAQRLSEPPAALTSGDTTFCPSGLRATCEQPPPRTSLSETLIHPIRRGLYSKDPFMCLPAPGLWQVNIDNGMCFRKGDPLNPCIQRLNMGGLGSIPHTEQHTQMFSSGPCVQRSREAGLWGVQTTLSRQATEREDKAARGRGRTPVLEDLRGDP